MVNLAISDCSTQVFTKSLSHHHSENIETYDTGRFFCNLAVDVHSISQKNTCINLAVLTVEYDDNRFNRCLVFFLTYRCLHITTSVILPVFKRCPAAATSQPKRSQWTRCPLIPKFQQLAANAEGGTGFWAMWWRFWMPNPRENVEWLWCDVVIIHKQIYKIDNYKHYKRE